MTDLPLDIRTLDLGNADLREALESLPARRGVIALREPAEQIVQIICSADIRRAMMTRFFPEAVGTRRASIDYRAFVRSMVYARCESRLEADLIYLHVVRAAFPATWHTLVPQRSIWFVRIEHDAKHPDVTRVESAPMTGEHAFGPFASASSADGWIDKLRDTFDLCRYPQILKQAPHGEACVYKQMGKCGAPCDGSMEMEDYRATARSAFDAQADPERFIEQMTARMQQAATELRFEDASRLKRQIESVQSMRRDGRGSSIGLVGSFQYVLLTPGPRARTLRICTLDGQNLSEHGALLDTRGTNASALPSILRQTPACLLRVGPDDQRLAQLHLATIAQHLHRPVPGAVLVPRSASDEQLINAARAIASRRPGRAASDKKQAFEEESQTPWSIPQGS